MKITNEEMEVLNRASEILSKYASQGDLSQDDFDQYEHMVVAIIDGIEDEEDTDDKDSKPILETPADGKQFPTTKWRIDGSLIQRNYALERTFGIEDIRIYGYYSDTNAIEIIGEIIASSIIKPFFLTCTVYDKDGDILETKENDSYGSGVVTSEVHPKAFFSGFPFTFGTLCVPRRKIKKISITPSSGSEENEEE